MDISYSYSWMGRVLEYTLTATELIIRVGQTERRVALDRVTAATYLKPFDAASYRSGGRSSSLKQVLVKKAMDVVANQAASQATLFLRIQEAPFRIQTVIADPANAEGAVFLARLKERFRSCLTADVSSLYEAYRVLGAPIHLRAILLLPRMLILGVLILAIVVTLASLR